MNPPFPSSEGHEKEYEFVNAALAELQDGGLLFTVLPYPYASKNWGLQSLASQCFA